MAGPAGRKTHLNMRYLQLLLLFVGIAHVSAQDTFYRQELTNLLDVSRLPLYRSGEMYQLSSYDTTGGNDDGFSGKYSFVRKEGNDFVIADLKGPGVINRIWTPTPTTDTIKFYFDGERKPRIAVPFIDLFRGDRFPFMAPLCGNQIGGYYCYLPIPYEKSLKIVYSGTNLRFHQTQYRTLDKRDKVKSFTVAMVDDNRDLFDNIEKVWNKDRTPLQQYGPDLKKRDVNLVLKPGMTETLFSMTNGGRIAGIILNASGGLADAYRRIMLTAQWDEEKINALDLPLHDFFGFAFGKPSMKSILLGSDSRTMYSYIPMPFDASCRLTLRYDKESANDPDAIVVSGTIYYNDVKRDKDREGKLYVQSRRHYNIPDGVPHLIADVTGRGHYIGSIVIAKGLEAGHTMFWEGDDVAMIDGEMRLHGTGSEDYFNGGWYAVMDRWNQGMSLPIHGSLEYDLATSRTGGYRFYLTDKLNFKKSLRLTIEHQPEAERNVKTDYTSLGIFYADGPQFENTPIRLSQEGMDIGSRDILTPQAMVLRLYWLASADFDDPAMVFSMKTSDSWTAKIDFDAVPMAQMFLNNLDNGKYKLYVEYGYAGASGDFSIWQGSRQISEWISPKQSDGEQKLAYAGEVVISDEMKTITLRKRVAENAVVRIYSFQFERVVGEW
jgi:uncharacterized protein YbaR (Trm112 family)|nr:MAG: hypothetical protein DIU61_05380 [Bacteroidota bacterium]